MRSLSQAVRWALPAGFIRWVGLAVCFGVVWLAGSEVRAEGGSGTNAAASGPKSLLVPYRRLPGGVIPQVTTRGISGQFVVSGASGVAPRTGAIPTLEGDVADVEVEPQWLAVAAERTKQAVLARLDLPDPWVGKIHLQIRPRRELGETSIRIVPVSFPNGWQYRVDVPDPVEWRRLVRALVEVVLLELANRDAGERLGLPPLWINEGMTELVLADRGEDLVLRSHTAVARNAQKPSLLTAARKTLSGRQPLLFSELSFPAESLMADPAAWRAFQASGAVFLHELLSDEVGRRSFATFLRRLPRHLNWQTGFIEAYQERFLSPLDVEKWWAVNSTHVLGRDPSLLWTKERTLDQLASILIESAEVASGTNAPAQRRAVPLAEVVETWSGPVQREVVRRKAAQLRELYARAPVEVLPLVTECYRVLEEYSGERFSSGSESQRRAELSPRAKVLALRASRRLRDLDRRIAALRRPAAMR